MLQERIKNLDDGWSEDVTSVCAGKITHKSKMCDQVYPVGEIDEDGLDEEGIYWDPDWGYKCNYKMSLYYCTSLRGNDETTTFETAKVGDRVWNLRFGWGPYYKH